MKRLRIKLQCGATVKVERTDGGFYLEVAQDGEITWATGSVVPEALDLYERWDLHYIRAYLSDRADLAKAFRDVADFIDEKDQQNVVDGEDYPK